MAVLTGIVLSIIASCFLSKKTLKTLECLINLLNAEDFSLLIKEYVGEDAKTILENLTTFLQDIGADNKGSNKIDLDEFFSID